MNTAIAFFNNKGGVGKTTLACNFASFYAEQGKKVAVVDCDPQANATQLLLEDKQWENLYIDENSADLDSVIEPKSEHRTILAPLKKIRDGDSGINPEFELTHSNRFDVDVLPGHPSLAAVEDILSSSWSELAGGQPGPMRRTLWVRSLREHINSDVLIFDMGPSLGPLNRSVLVGCDFFVTPVAADLFSLYALKNIGSWMQGWLEDYELALERVRSKNPRMPELKLTENSTVSRRWFGYTVQQYVSKTSAGEVRSIKSYDRYKRQIPKWSEDLMRYKAPAVDNTELGLVPNMFSMVPLAQAKHAPISKLTNKDGLRGAQGSQRASYTKQLEEIFLSIIQNLGKFEVA